jgi:hypothetical protein
MERAPSRHFSEIDLTSYAGRWVAIVRGRVTGVGATAVQARLASKTQREREEPMLIFVTENRKK